MAATLRIPRFFHPRTDNLIQPQINDILVYDETRRMFAVRRESYMLICIFRDGKKVLSREDWWAPYEVEPNTRAVFEPAKVAADFARFYGLCAKPTPARRGSRQEWRLAIPC